MPRAIILYEIDPSFGPNILAEYYLKQEDKISPAVLKEFSEKHIKKESLTVTIRKDNNRYYSSKLNAESIDKENLFLSFILQEEEDFISLKSIFENIEAKVILGFSADKKKMSDILKNGLNTFLNLVQRLKEPEIIKDILNERTKKILDDGQLQEARELIDLGEDIPQKLAAEVKIADQLLKDAFYKKAKKSFLKAAELAVLIQEEDIVSFLQNKGEQVGMFPELLKERENLYKEIVKIISEFLGEKLDIYNQLIEPIDRLIEISDNFEEHELIDVLTKLKNGTQRASRLGKDLYGLEDKLKELFENI